MLEEGGDLPITWVFWCFPPFNERVLETDMGIFGICHVGEEHASKFATLACGWFSHPGPGDRLGFGETASGGFW